MPTLQNGNQKQVLPSLVTSQKPGLLAAKGLATYYVIWKLWTGRLRTPSIHCLFGLWTVETNCSAEILVWVTHLDAYGKGLFFTSCWLSHFLTQRFSAGHTCDTPPPSPALLRYIWEIKSYDIQNVPLAMKTHSLSKLVGWRGDLGHMEIKNWNMQCHHHALFMGSSFLSGVGRGLKFFKQGFEVQTCPGVLAQPCLSRRSMKGEEASQGFSPPSPKHLC